MRKLLLILIILSICLTSCSRERSADCRSLMDSADHGKSGYRYSDCLDKSAEEYISETELSRLYYGKSLPLAELEYIEEFCIFISNSLTGEEIHILKARHQSDTDSLLRMLECRAELLSKGQINPNQGDFLFPPARQCVCFSKGRFVFLAVGERAEELRSALLSLL